MAATYRTCSSAGLERPGRDRRHAARRCRAGGVVERKIHERRAVRCTGLPSSPATPWFVRVTFPGVLPGAAAAASLVAGVGLPVERVADHATGNSRWLFIGPQGAATSTRRSKDFRTPIASRPAAFRRLNMNRHCIFATRAIHSAQPSDPATGALVAPIYQTSTYEQESPGVNLGFDYSRTNNPTRQRLEQVLAELEGVSHCAVFASGLAAEHAVLHAYLRPHDEIIVPLDVYGGRSAC
jgi:hypothetical protein